MPPPTIDNNTNSSYDETTPDNSQTPGSTSDDTNRAPSVTHHHRAVKTAHLTVEVHHVSGPEAAILARTQYDAIRKVLEWVTDHPQ